MTTITNIRSRLVHNKYQVLGNNPEAFYDSIYDDSKSYKENFRLMEKAFLDAIDNVGHESMEEFLKEELKSSTINYKALAVRVGEAANSNRQSRINKCGSAFENIPTCLLRRAGLDAHPRKRVKMEIDGRVRTKMTDIVINDGVCVSAKVTGKDRATSDNHCAVKIMKGVTKKERKNGAGWGGFTSPESFLSWIADSHDKVLIIIDDDARQEVIDRAKNEHGIEPLIYDLDSGIQKLVELYGNQQL